MSRRLALPLVVLFGFVSSPAAALDPYKFNPISKDFDPETPEETMWTKEQANRDPLSFSYILQDYSVLADKSLNEGDYPTAVKYYRALAKGVPEAAVAFEKACEAYEGLKDYENAREWCLTALGKEGVTVGTYRRYIQLVLLKPELTTDELEELDEVLNHMKAQKADARIVHEADCAIGIRTRDEPRLERCTAALTEVAPDAPSTLVNEWYLAEFRKDHRAAVAVLERASEVGMDPTALARLQELTKRAIEADRPWYRRYWWVFAGLAVLLAGAALLGFAGRSKDPEASPQSA